MFQHALLQSRIDAQAERIKSAYERYGAYFLNADIQRNIRCSKEEQFQEGFLRELFVNVLGYTLNPDADYNLITEKKNETDEKIDKNVYDLYGLSVDDVKIIEN